MEGETLVTLEPGSHLGMLVGSIVVEDDVDGLVVRCLGVNGVEEADELLMTMTLHVAANDGAVENVEGGEQRGCAVPLVVVGHGAEPALLHRQARLGAVERLDLAFLIDRQHDGVGWRINIEADDVSQLVDEFRVVGQFELPPPVRCEAMRFPDAPDCAGADAGDRRHHVGRPVRRLARRISKRQGHHTLGDIGTEPHNARRPRLVAQETLDAFCGEALLPAPYAGLRFAGLSHDFDSPDAIGTQQDDLGPPDVLLGRIAIPGQGHQALVIGWRNGERYSCAHAPDSHANAAKGIPYRTLMSGGNH